MKVLGSARIDRDVTVDAGLPGPEADWTFTAGLNASALAAVRVEQCTEKVQARCHRLVEDGVWWVYCLACLQQGGGWCDAGHRRKEIPE